MANLPLPGDLGGGACLAPRPEPAYLLGTMNVFDLDLARLNMHPAIEALLRENGCQTIGDVLHLPGQGLEDSGITAIELREIAQRVEDLQLQESKTTNP